MSATRLGKYLLTTLAFFPLLQLLAVSAQGQTPITSCGTVINTPGQYYLANDLNCHDYEVAITIESANVELDLDHHQITGPGAGSQASGGINVTRSARSNILLRGPGVIRKMKVGVFIDSGEALVGRLTCTGNSFGMWIERGATVLARGNTASQNTEVGMWIFGSGGEFGGNTVNGNGYGILIEGNGNHIDHTNVAQDNLKVGIEARGTGNVIDRNRSQFNGRYDMDDDHSTCENTWRNNTFGRANLSCIH